MAGDDTAATANRARQRAADTPVAVDARDYDNPNDWGSPCRATGYRDGSLVFDGGGAQVHELTEAPALYPTDCSELSLTETVTGKDSADHHVGDLVTWELTPHNDGPAAAPRGLVHPPAAARRRRPRLPERLEATR